MDLRTNAAAAVQAAQNLAKLGGFDPELFTGGSIDTSDDGVLVVVTAKRKEVWLDAMVFADDTEPTVRVMRWIGTELQNIRTYRGWAAFSSAAADYAADLAVDAISAPAGVA